MMLFAIRERAKGWFAWFIVILISVPFALWGIGSYISPDPNPPIAVVNGVGITTSQFQTALQQQQNDNKTFNPAQDKQVVLQRLINNQALLNHLGNQGYVNSAATLDQQIMSDENFNDLKTGQFSQEQFNLSLRRMGLTYSYYRSLVNDDLLIQQYLNAMNQGSFITSKEQANILRLLKQQRDIEYVEIDGNQFKDSIIISDMEVNDYYDQYKNEFEVPEQVKLAYLEVSRKVIAKNVELAEDEILAAYEENKGSYTTAEERQASHILIAIDENTDESSAKKLADDLYARLNQGEDFSTLAQQHSKDPGSAANGGDLGYFVKGDMVPEFEQTTYALKMNEISEPVKSSFGFHIIKLTGIKVEEIKPFSQVADKIKSELQYDRAEKIFVQMSEDLQTIAYEQPDSLDAASSAIEQSIKYSPFFSNGRGNDVFANPKLNTTAFSDLVLEEGNNSDLVEISDDHVMVIRLDQRKNAQIKPLEQVKAEISEKLSSTKLADMTNDLAQKLEKAISSSEQEFEKLLTENKLIVVKKGFVERGAQGIPPAIADKAFRLPRSSDKSTKDKLSVSTVKTSQQSSALVMVKAVKDGDVNDKAMGDSLGMLLNRSISTLLSNLSVSQIGRQSDIEIFAERMSAE